MITLIPHLLKKTLAREFFLDLTNLFQSNNANTKMALKEKFRNTKMIRSDTVINYFTKITLVHNHLATVGEAVIDQEMVMTALNGFSKPWGPFIKGIIAGRNFYILTSYGMISSRRRFKRNL